MPGQDLTEEMNELLYAKGTIGLPNFGLDMSSVGVLNQEDIQYGSHSVSYTYNPDFDTIYDESGFAIGTVSKQKEEYVLQETHKPIQYKYAEGQIISDFKAYIDKTYSQHYKTEDANIECFDAWIALGDATPTFRNTALKYLWRYGKKNGNNKNDLLKALHYIILCLYNDHYKDGK